MNDIKEIFRHLVILLAATCGLAYASGAANETVVYDLEFPDHWRPGTVRGRAEVQGAIRVVRDMPPDPAFPNAPTISMSWDLTKGVGLGSNYLRAEYNHEIIGRPFVAFCRVFAEPNQVGVPLRAWIRDSSGEIFISTQKVTQAGWSTIEFDFSALKAAFPSGNKNSVIDLPARLMGIAIEQPGTTGEIILGSIQMRATGTPRDFLIATLQSEQRLGLFWGRGADFQFVVKNPATQTRRNLQASLKINDATTGESLLRTTLPIGTVDGGSLTSFPYAPELKAGVYSVEWEVSDSEGVFPFSKGKTTFARMHADVAAHAATIGQAERNYVRNWGQIGGIFWSATRDLDRVAKTGGIWERFGNTSLWQALETEPGKLDVSRSLNEVRRLHDAGFNLVYFNTVYNQPEFYQVDQEQFALKYGLLHREQAKAFGNLVETWELGNEDNGKTRFIYTEIARHGAAGVRSSNADAMIANSGTAQIDVGWLRMQASRRLFERMDVLVTHPYSWSSPPEAYGVYDQLGQVDALIDELGGMKVQITTEFGYPEVNFSQLKRAQWIPRHFAIGTAAGLWRHGLYAFDNHFGIYDNGRPFPAAATVNAYSSFTHGHRFAGWLEKSEKAWIAAFEKAGQPLIMAWTFRDGATHTISVSVSSEAKVHDMFGNIITEGITRDREGHLAILIDESPRYVTGADPKILETAFSDSLRRADERYRKLLPRSSFKNNARWTAKNLNESAMRQALLEWKPTATDGLSREDQAVVAQMLRAFRVAVHGKAARMGSDAAVSGSVSPEDSRKAREKWLEWLRASVADDLDVPAMRWLLHCWEETLAEIALANELGRGGYARQLTTLTPVYEHVAQQLSHSVTRVFFPIWPYAHASSTEGKLRERIQFIPARPVPVKVRLHSWSAKSHQGKLRLDLPQGWSSLPEVWQGEIEPEKTLDITFMVTAGDALARSFDTVLQVQGKPDVRIPYDDFEILPPFDITLGVLPSLLPQSPLPLQVTNNGSRPLDATVRLLSSQDKPSLATARISRLAPRATEPLPLRLPEGVGRPDFNDWQLIAELTTVDNKRFLAPLVIDFDLAVKASAAPQIDGNLDEWKDAAPLHLNQESYTHGSFSGSWSPDDLSGVVWTKWDEHYLYIAARVRDQLFQQDLSEADVWNQDSVQIAIAENGASRFEEFSLALTPKGAQVWGFREEKLVEGARLHVELKPSETIYEAAIPWSAIRISPKTGKTLRFDVLLNDHDAIINRRTMERYGMGIVHTKKVSDLGFLRLGVLDATRSEAGEQADNKVVFFENFEEYTAGSAPERWTHRGNNRSSGRAPSSLVQKNGGIANTQCLRLENETGAPSNTFSILSRPFADLVLRKRYRLSAMVKGETGGEPRNMIGIAADEWGNLDMRFIPPWKPSRDWQEVSMEFTIHGGKINVIIKNERCQLDGLLIDNVRITELE